MRIAPQETRTYFVTAVTAQRRRLFQVTSTAELLQGIILDYREQGSSSYMPSFSRPIIFTR
jgi:putative transposase